MNTDKKEAAGQSWYCNPLNVEYRYQFCREMYGQDIQIGREAADPSMICFKGKYYIFASMTLSVWVSEDLVHWESHRLPENLPLYDYAPDARVMGEYVYFCASRNESNCSFYRTKDILAGPYEEIPGTFPFWDPNLFMDDDGRIYFYWGCASDTPIWGVELDPETMRPLTDKQELIWGDAAVKGYERIGDDHSIMPVSEAEALERFQEMLRLSGTQETDYPPDLVARIKAYYRNRPYIEGAWMDKYKGRYYLQYAFAGTEYNGYGDGVCVSDKPLGPFVPAENNPYSYHPGGFFTGAGHGSTMRDNYGNLWHTATMRISKNFNFERRVGLWPAGFDTDGQLFCNQRYGDWPVPVQKSAADPWAPPQWYLLSYGKTMSASSMEAGMGPENAADENVRTWWKAAGPESGQQSVAGRCSGTVRICETDRWPESGQWLEMDLGMVCRVHGVQINFADDKIQLPVPGRIHTETEQTRYIDETVHVTRWVLEGSLDGETYFILEDKSRANTNLPHDLVVKEEGVMARHIRLTVLETPWHLQPCISGLRVFGLGPVSRPAMPCHTVCRTGDLDMEVEIHGENAMGYVILWGLRPDKLYHSYMVYGRQRQCIGALVRKKTYYVRVDAFNEAGITEGMVTGPH